MSQEFCKITTHTHTHTHRHTHIHIHTMTQYYKTNFLDGNGDLNTHFWGVTTLSIGIPKEPVNRSKVRLWKNV